MKLHDLPAELRAIEAEIEEAGGEITEKTAAKLAEFERNLRQCADWYGALITEAKGNAAVLDEELARLRERRDTELRRAERFKERLKAALEAMGADKVKAELFTVRLQRNSVPTIAVNVPVASLPERYHRLKVEADLDAIKADWKAGQTLPDGVTVALGSHLRVS